MNIVKKNSQYSLNKFGDKKTLYYKDINLPSYSSRLSTIKKIYQI